MKHKDQTGSRRTGQEATGPERRQKDQTGDRRTRQETDGRKEWEAQGARGRGNDRCREQEVHGTGCRGSLRAQAGIGGILR